MSYSKQRVPGSAWSMQEWVSQTEREAYHAVALRTYGMATKSMIVYSVVTNTRFGYPTLLLGMASSCHPTNRVRSILTPLLDFGRITCRAVVNTKSGSELM
jgi:hypothetical protein